MGPNSGTEFEVLDVPRTNTETDSAVDRADRWTNTYEASARVAIVNDDNHVRTTIEAGDAVLGARATTLEPLVVEVYGALGLDFVWIDLEHTGPSAFDAPALEALSRAGDAAGIELLVRVPSGEPALVRTVLDAGVRTILVPRVESADDVRPAISASRFSYDGTPGTRGAAAARTNTWGARDRDPAREDADVLVGAMIESETAVENAAEILAVPELGFVFLGPSDLSISLGLSFQTDHPDVRDALKRARSAALSAGVPVGCIANDVETARTALDDGFQLLRIGDEIEAARTVLGDRLAGIRQSMDK